MNDDELNELREKFFAYLLKRPCTQKQAHEYLLRNRVHDDVIDLLIDEAMSSGLIDDLTFAKLFAEGHLTWGNLKIAYELGMRGISRGNIRDALDEVEDEVVRARELSESWYEMNIDERKIASRLMSRGFSRGAIRGALHDE